VWLPLSSSAASVSVSSRFAPRLEDLAAHPDGGAGQADEGADYYLTPLIPALQPAGGVVPGVRAFDGRATAGLDRRLLAPVRDLAGHPASGQLIPGDLGVVPASTWARMSPRSGPGPARELVQRGGQQRTFVAAGYSQQPCQVESGVVGEIGHVLLAHRHPGADVADGDGLTG
jgi:hypothetical protein